MPACIIYTSGTSGNPKGVVLSHGGILSNCEGAVELLEILTKKKDPVFLTWLPLSHSYEHTVQFIQIIVGAKVFYAESLEKLISNMAMAKPTIMTAVPRFYQNLFTKINMNFEKQSGLKKTLINQTLNLGKKILKKKIIGVTCHNSLNLVKKAIRAKASYIALGAFYPSKTKKTKYTASIKILNKVKKFTNTKIVAIGGINSDNYKNLLLNKVKFLAISGYIWNNKLYKPLQAIQRLK